MAVTDQVKRKAVWGWRIGVLALAIAVGPSCGDQTRAGKGSSYLIIENLLGVTSDDSEVNVLQSDVLTFGGVFEDGGIVSMRLALKDPGSAQSPNNPTPNNFITVTRYQVVYKRADGRNTPGVDVPYPFDGAISFTAVTGTTSATFVLVRAQAKLEAPLMALRYVGGSLLISTIAEVTFYGHDQTGTPVSVTGKIGVNFGDWADPDS